MREVSINLFLNSMPSREKRVSGNLEPRGVSNFLPVTFITTTDAEGHATRVNIIQTRSATMTDILRGGKIIVRRSLYIKKKIRGSDPELSSAGVFVAFEARDQQIQDKDISAVHLLRHNSKAVARIFTTVFLDFYRTHNWLSHIRVHKND